jgi:hypothetical protein
MSDTAIAEAPAEPVPLVPQAAAELEAAVPDTAPPEANEQVVASAEPEADARTLPEIEHPIGPLRQAVLDALLDADEPLSVSRILAEMPAGTTRGSAESAIRRELVQGRIERVAAGTYRIAKSKPPEAKPKPPSPPPPPTPDEEATWFSVLEAWAVDPASWNVEELGPRPNEPDNRIPTVVKLRFNDRLRKREERRREANAAAAKRAAADAELRDRLISATGGNIVRGSGIDDVAPIKLALEVVPLERVLSAIRCKTDRKLYPRNEPATSWREERLLREIAESYCRTMIVPNLIAAWSKAGKVASASLPPAAPMADIDELRSQHDSEHEPAGPHTLSGPDVIGKFAEREEASPVVSAAPEAADARAPSPGMSVDGLDDELGQTDPLTKTGGGMAELRSRPK